VRVLLKLDKEVTLYYILQYQQFHAWVVGEVEAQLKPAWVADRVVEADKHMELIGEVVLERLDKDLMAGQAEAIQ